MYLDAGEMSMVPVMVVRVPVMTEADKDKLRKQIMSGIFDGLLLNMLNGDEAYPIDVWRQVGKGLDKVAGKKAG